MAESMVFPVRTYFIEPQPKAKRKNAKPVSKEEQESFYKAVERSYKTPKIIKATTYHSKTMPTQKSVRGVCSVCGEKFEVNDFGRPATMCYKCRRIPARKRKKVDANG